ncbi:MAG: autotransporter outer membrane beta-barrel domain-containing protein [Lysobacteraceae bacterium]
MSSTPRRRARHLAALFALLFCSIAAPSKLLAQTPAEALDAAWLQVCAQADPDSSFYARCQDILNAGPGSGDRRSAAALGNNLGVFAAQIKIARSRVARQAADGADQQNDDDALSLDGSTDETLWQSERWGLFASAYGSDIKRPETDFENGFNSDVWGATLGVDYRFSANLVGLLSIGVRHHEAQFVNDRGRMNDDARNFTVGLYGNIGDHFGWQASIGRDNLDYDTARRIQYSLIRNAGQPDENQVDVDFLAVASMGGRQDLANLGGDWSWYRDAWSFRAGLGADYSKVSIDPFTESGGGGLDIRFARRASKSLRGYLSFEVSRSNSASWGVWTPYARLDWYHESKDDGRVLPAFFAGDPSNTRIGFASAAPDRNFGNLGIGISAIRPGGWQWFIGVDRSIGYSTLTETRLNAGLRKSF